MSTQADTNSLGLGGHFVRHFPTRPPAPPVSVSEVARQSEMMAIGDGFRGGREGILDGEAWLQRSYDRRDSSGSTGKAEARQGGKANIVFCDSHVESRSLKFLFQSTNEAALVRWNRDHQPHYEILGL
jgi:prepilin-type processing-associated H-X9-DG protein